MLLTDFKDMPANYPVVFDAESLQVSVQTSKSVDVSKSPFLLRLVASYSGIPFETVGAYLDFEVIITDVCENASPVTATAQSDPTVYSYGVEPLLWTVFPPFTTEYAECTIVYSCELVTGPSA